MNHETLGEAPADALTAVDDAADSVVESGISSGKGGGEKTRSMSEGVEAATAISSQEEETSNLDNDPAPPKLKQASDPAVGGGEMSSLPSRLQISHSERFSPSSSRNSSPQRGRRGRRASSGSPSRSLSASLNNSLGERPGVARGRRTVGGGSSGMPSSGTRGLGNEARSSLSNRTSPRTSHSPDTKRTSMSFGDFVAASNTELSLLESSRLSANGKRPRDRNALRVAVRIRPLIEREKGSRAVTCDGGDGRMVVVNPIKFKASADAGFNCSCFAYGHTGSGKTYSMFGCSDTANLPDNDEALAAPPQGECFGLVPRVCFSLLNRLEEANTDILKQEPGTSSVGVSVQFIEIYNDRIRDLLHAGADSSALRVREHPQTGPYVDNLVPVKVESWSQLRQLLALGTSARSEADTPENIKSSRGHAILTMEVNTPTGPSRVQMVDLAGSEREVVANSRSSDGRTGRERGAGGSGGSVDGRTVSQRLTLSQRLRETAQIKKALSNLGIIIKGLSRGDTPVGLPFRDSILTWLLKEALSGRAHTTMLATVSPSSNSYVETMSTLKYAERLKKANAHLNKDSGGARVTTPSDGMKKEMASLVEKLGADGIEAKRQVLYQTVSDPQQRIAKLTAKDPRRRRTSSGGSAAPIGDRRSGDEDVVAPRRTSFPGSLSSQRFGWKATTPSRASGRTRSPSGAGGTGAWGSPINTPDDASLEGNVLDEGPEQDKHGAGIRVGTMGDDGRDKENSTGEGAGAGITDGGSAPLGVTSPEPEAPSFKAGLLEGGYFGRNPDLPLYSESDSESAGGGNAEGATGENTDGIPGSVTGDEGGGGGGGGDGVPGSVTGDRGGGGGGHDGGGGGSIINANGHEESVAVMQLDGSADGGRDNSVGEQRPQAWLPSPGSGASPTWAGTSSSEDAEPHNRSRTDANSEGATAGMSTVAAEGGDAATIPTCPPVSDRGDAPPRPETTGTHVTGSSDTYVGGSTDTFFGEPSDPHETGSTGMMTGRVPNWGETSGNDIAGPTVEPTAEGPDSRRASGTQVAGSTSVPTGGPAGGREPSGKATESTTVRMGEVADSPVLTGRVPDTATSSAPPSRRITWSVDEVESTGNGRHHPAGRTGDQRRHEAQAQGPPVDSGRRNQQHAEERDDPPLPLPETLALNSSVESGGGAAALAASGVFDVTGTSAEGEGDSVSVGDVDSLDGSGVRAEAWARPPHPAHDHQEGRQGVAGGSGGVASTDTRGLIEELMQQIEQLKASNASLTEEARRLQDELRRSKESEEEAWAIGDDTAKEFQTRLASMQRDLEEQASRAREAERKARDADASSQLLDDVQRRMREAERRADGAEAREEDLVARENDARARLAASEAALEEQLTAAGEAQRLLDESRSQAKEAEQRAAAAAARAEELEARANDNRAQLERSKAAAREREALEGDAQRLVDDSRCRAEEADQRAAEAEAREARLKAHASDARTRLESVQAALEGQEATAEEAQRLLDESRRRAEEAERRAAGAAAREAELDAMVKDARAQMSDSQAQRAEEAERLVGESRRRAEEAERRTAGAEARAAELEGRAKDALAETSGLQAELVEADQRVEESRRRVEEAEQRAAGAEAREQEVESCASDTRTRLKDSQAALKDQKAVTQEIEQLLDASRRQATEAEQRAAGAEARGDQLEARANDARAQLEASKAALKDQTTMTEEAERKVRQIQAALEATGSGVGTAVAASQRSAGQERERAAEAEVRANRAVTKANELTCLVDEHENRLRKARASLEAEGSRADGAEVRERRTAALAEELAGVVKEKDTRLARLQQALEGEGARADEMEASKRAAESRVRELERETERRLRDLERVEREAKASLDAVRAAAETDMDHAAQRTDAIVEERDRCLEQVEAERTEVLRLAGELNDLRAAAEQEATAGREKEAALKAMLASETEASRAEQVEVEDLLSLISSAQDPESGGRTADDAAASIPGARAAIEAQWAKHEASRRRVQALEDDNRALKQREAEAQANLDRLGLLEEERDFLLREKDTLVGRLGNLEARQASLQERERQAENREGEAALARDGLEDQVRGLKERLARETDLRAKEAKEFADRLKEKEDQAEEQLGDTLKQVMEGVKSQAGHIRGTVTQLEEERDRAISGKQAAVKELEDIKCELEAVKKEKSEARSDFDEQMKQSARERAALWLAVNKLDVLEAAKDSAIKELQKEGEDKARALKVLQAHNAGLTRELGQVDMSLMQALEDNGLTLDSVRLQNTPMSRRLGRRRPSSHDPVGITNGRAAGSPPPEPEEIDYGNMYPVAGRGDGTPWQQSPTRLDMEGGRERPPRSHSRAVGRPGRREEDSRTRKHMTRTRSAGPEGYYAGDGGRMHSGSGASSQTDRWDPAINTIEREIEQLSERLDTGRVRRVSSQADLPGEDPSRGGKRLRLRTEVSPPRTQEVKKRERRAQPQVT
ncbi:conserved unknown protein [Ectocarpus siliculosus]|uniref:Kinesin motor domain-containing protein n=1 Tax=Ectocarpus siliculosus TaxID=2880 RepID=D7FKQ0_ECTSI|nr:conserved unknown protein [Ectocarpus siliculosus]|eukprot:CBJ29449.1 conserved unknown protein [Ectocarpus siliculosus]